MGTYIVTGASAGIGRDLALTLARRKHKVFALARSAARLDIVAAAGDGLIVPITIDLTDMNAIALLDEHLVGEEIDGLINNAAIQENCRFDAEGYDAAAIAAEVATNLTAPILLTQLAARHARKRLTVINVNSGLGLFPKSTAAVYSATKAGLRMFGTAIAAQGGQKLTIIDVILPLVDTGMTAGRGKGKMTPEAAAAAILAALDQSRREVFVGKAKALRILARLAPSMTARIMRRM